MLASEASIENFMMQAGRYYVIGLTETRRQRPLNAIFDTGEELFLGTRNGRGVGGGGVLVNTNLVMNIDSFEQLTTQVGRLRLRRYGSTQALTIFVAYAPTSGYDEDEIEAFHMVLEKFYRESHTSYKSAFGKMPLSTTSTKSTIALFSISTTAQRALRVHKAPRGDCLTRPST
ncbi:hypothetical protein ANCDUO_01857 [Ancylostoma duodenale]|uniref:Uncharacterized protein n=1 Tax=Ancylostoma duodenale TaxID=51022 RepID=A0A0C2DXW5_9BILA|nr:hypothetical protein ANCDUO_01857 [Ancylostoma duodenale]